MGRNRSNPALLEAEGAFKKNPQRRIDTVKAVVGRPPAPLIVSECPLTHEIWNETLGHLESMGILSFADEHLLAEYCSTYAEFLKLTKAVREFGHFYTSPDGLVKAHPASASWDRAKSSLIRLQSQLGLTPSARASIKAPGKDTGPSEAESLMGEFGL